jgi:hypothetical protein
VLRVSTGSESNTKTLPRDIFLRAKNAGFRVKWLLKNVLQSVHGNSHNLGVAEGNHIFLYLWRGVDFFNCK